MTAWPDRGLGVASLELKGTFLNCYKTMELVDFETGTQIVWVLVSRLRKLEQWSVK
jgi:hypothetical protein